VDWSVLASECWCTRMYRGGLWLWYTRVGSGVPRLLPVEGACRDSPLSGNRAITEPLSLELIVALPINRPCHGLALPGPHVVVLSIGGMRACAINNGIPCSGSCAPIAHTGFRICQACRW
jgi:hypothetical protein